MQSLARRLLTGFMLMFCFGILVIAQNSGILSKQPPVMKTFDPDKNESTVSAFLIEPRGNPGGLDPDHPPPEIRLQRAEYAYPGRTEARPQTVAFVFLPLDKYKTPPNFSVMADGAIIHQGEGTIDELCCEKVNGHTYTRQEIIVAMPLEVFERITQARKVELRLVSKSGKFSFKLNDYQKKCVTALANTIK